jgi:plasmid stabilization system protein ParE
MRDALRALEQRRFGVHLIFYRADDEVLGIERILHRARDLPRRLLEPPGQ